MKQFFEIGTEIANYIGTKRFIYYPENVETAKMSSVYEGGST